jgi:uncharacterized protein YegP (UPF0339 family)
MERQDDYKREKPPPHHRGWRHLRVGLEIRDAAVRVTSLWVVEQPAIQSSRLVGPIFTRVDLATTPVLLEGFADPRVTRSTYREKLGHHYSRSATGIVEVSVPFTDVRELADIRIRLIDASTSQTTAGDPALVEGLFDRPRESMVVVGDIGAASLRQHPDWLKVAARLGLPAVPGCIEIYLDAEKRYRWRICRASGDVLAESAKAYETREACEADVAWMRAHAGSLEVCAADTTGRTCL